MTMANVYILPINDDVAGPALELLRGVVQPNSRSLPHITVRYSKEESYLPENRLYSEFVADEVSLIEPSTFDHEGSQRSAVGTVFFRSSSDQLEHLQYKPDFPQSVFHISIYDGPPNEDAANVLKILREYPWHLRIPLPRTSLTRGVNKTTPAQGPISSASESLLAELGYDIGVLSAPFLEKVAVVRAVCQYLHRELPRTNWGADRDPNAEPVVEFHPDQGAFWSRIELMDDMTRNRALSAERSVLRSRGSFMTPPEIAYDIVRAASDLFGGRDARYGDPSTGGGIFLAALLRQIGPQRIRAATLVEADRTSAAVTAGRWNHLGYDVTVDDFVNRMLSEGQAGSPESQAETSENEGVHWFDERPNLVITNPPYVRSQSLDNELVEIWREAIRRNLGIRVDRRSDLFSYFVLSSHSWIEDGGLGAWLLPSEFMFTNYGSALRKYLAEHVTLLRVHLYDGPSVFSNARVSSCAVFYLKRPPVKDSLAIFSAGGSIDKSNQSRSVLLSSLSSAKKWHRIADDGVLPDASMVYDTLDRWFEVRRGIATGANNFFVVDQAAKDSFGEGVDQWLKPVLPKARQLVGPVVESDAFGRPVLPEIKWLIDSSATLEEIEKASPALAQYLREIQVLVSGRTLVSRRKPFYKQERNRPPRFFFSYMSRDAAPARRFYLNRSGAVALNNYLVLHPRPELQEWLDSKADRDLQVLRALRELDAATLERAGRVYVEGLTKIEPRELASMPFRFPAATIRESGFDIMGL